MDKQTPTITESGALRQCSSACRAKAKQLRQLRAIHWINTILTLVLVATAVCIVLGLMDDNVHAVGWALLSFVCNLALQVWLDRIYERTLLRKISPGGKHE